MATCRTSGLAEIMLSLEEIAQLPDETAGDMLLAQAEIIEKQQKATGLAMGVNRTGDLLDSITHGNMKKTANGSRAVFVYPQGVNRKGTRNAEVAFINEFGKRGQKARPFIKTANEKSETKAFEAAAEVYARYLATKNL